MTAALMGLVPAVVLGLLRAVNMDGPISKDTVPGDIVFTIVYASPYLVALYASRLSQAAPQASLLLTATLLSLAASFSALSGVTLALLPATVLLGLATVRAFRASEKRWAWKSAVALGAIIGAALIGGSFFTLFLRDDARCWEFTEYNDGRATWRSVPVPATGPSGPISLLAAPEDAISQEAFCLSDVITPSEALGGLGGLAVGLFAVAVLSRYISRMEGQGEP